jgi:alpha-beta hydrolase superfamily lysophospholipase
MLAGIGRAMNIGINFAQEHGNKFDLPVLIMHGRADRLTDPKGSQYLYDQAKSADKSIKLYDGLFHELVNEPEKEMVMQDMLSWMEARI